MADALGPLFRASVSTGIERRLRSRISNGIGLDRRARQAHRHEVIAQVPLQPRPQVRATWEPENDLSDTWLVQRSLKSCEPSLRAFTQRYRVHIFLILGAGFAEYCHVWLMHLFCALSEAAHDDTVLVAAECIWLSQGVFWRMDCYL